MRTRTWRNRLFVPFALLAVLTCLTGGELRANSMWQWCDSLPYTDHGCWWQDDPMICQHWWSACQNNCSYWGGVYSFVCDGSEITSGYCECWE